MKFSFISTELLPKDTYKYVLFLKNIYIIHNFSLKHLYNLFECTTIFKMHVSDYFKEGKLHQQPSLQPSQQKHQISI